MTQKPMNPSLLAVFSIPCLAVSAIGQPLNMIQDSANYSEESDPTNNDVIRKEASGVTSIKSGSWVRYDNFDFSAHGAICFLIEAAGNNGTIELLVDEPDGQTSIGRVTITAPPESKAAFDKYQEFTCPVSPGVSGKKNLILKFTGNDTGAYLFNTRSFRFVAAAAPSTSSKDFDEESAPDDENVIQKEAGNIGFIANDSWVLYKNFHFNPGDDQFIIDAAVPPGASGKIEIRTKSRKSIPIGSVNITSTQGFEDYRQFVGVVTLPPTVSVADLYLIFTGTSPDWLFNTRSFRFQNSAMHSRNPLDTINSSSFELTSPSAPVTKDGFGASNIMNGSAVIFNNVDFGPNTNAFQIEAATVGKGGAIELRSNSPNGELFGTVNVFNTESSTLFQPFTGLLKKGRIPTGKFNLCMKFVASNGTAGGHLFNTRCFSYWNQTANSGDNK